MRPLKLIAGLSMGRLAVLAVLAIIGYYLSYFDDGSSLETQVSGVNSQVEAETNRRSAIERAMKKEEEMRGNLLQLQRNLEVVKSKIPSEFKDTQMSAILNVATGASGATLIELSTQAAQATEPKVIDPNTVKPEDLIEEVKFNIVITGSYESLLKFLARQSQPLNPP